MSITTDIRDWYMTKRERGAAGAPGRAFGSFDRHENRQRKKDIKKLVEALSGTTCMRDSMFVQFRHLQIDRLVDRDHGIRRNRIRGIRMMRLNNGNPPVFNPGQPFWYDLNSKFVPEDEIRLARKAGVEFHRLTMLMYAGRAVRIATEIESRRPHAGYWSYTDHDHMDYKHDERQPVTWLFENLGDLFHFRMAHDYPNVDEPPPPEPHSRRTVSAAPQPLVEFCG